MNSNLLPMDHLHMHISFVFTMFMSEGDNVHFLKINLLRSNIQVAPPLIFYGPAPPTVWYNLKKTTKKIYDNRGSSHMLSS